MKIFFTLLLFCPVVALSQIDTTHWYESPLKDTTIRRDAVKGIFLISEREPGSTCYTIAGWSIRQQTLLSTQGLQWQYKTLSTDLNFKLLPTRFILWHFVPDKKE